MLQQNKNHYRVIGLMSGTSLDGLDMVCCDFENKNGKWNYSVLAAETIEYKAEWKKTFLKLEQANAAYFCEWDRKIGEYFGQQTAAFISKYHLQHIDFLSSHGHTIFHQPEKKFTVQVGHGAALAAAAKLPVVCDFRSKDVALGGQGAPLVPIGDKLLYSDYDFCLNLGGIANISFTDKNNQTLAYDVAPANMVLNFLAQKAEKQYDAGGAIASKGKTIDSLLNKLNNLAFYSQSFPKSLGKEWVLANVIPLFETLFEKESINDLMATACEHSAQQIAATVNSTGKSGAKILVTGGGAFNTFLINLLVEKLSGKAELIIPDENTVKFKEAIIFALLGVLRITHSTNALASVTGAEIDNIGGCVYL